MYFHPLTMMTLYNNLQADSGMARGNVVCICMLSSPLVN